MESLRHLSAEQLARIVARDLPEDEREEALRHLEVCTECGDRLAAVLLLRQGGAVPLRRGRWAMAAAVVAGLLAGAWLLSPTLLTDPGPPPLSPERQALVDQFASYARDDNIDPMIYDFVLRIDYPEMVPLASDHHLPRARSAIEDLRDNRYGQAVEQLAALYRDYPDFDSIAGWLGVALYLSGETDPVVESLLERGLQSGIDPLQRMSQWYGAQYLLRTERPEQAVAMLRELSRSPVMIGRMAKAQLEEMPLEELGLAEDAVDLRT